MILFIWEPQWDFKCAAICNNSYAIHMWLIKVKIFNSNLQFKWINIWNMCPKTPSSSKIVLQSEIFQNRELSFSKHILWVLLRAKCGRLLHQLECSCTCQKGVSSFTGLVAVIVFLNYSHILFLLRCTDNRPFLFKPLF